MKKFVKTRMFKSYLLKFLIRLVIFISVFIIYISDKSRFEYVMKQPLLWNIGVWHILWFVFMIMMLGHIFPTPRLSMALRKLEKERYFAQENYSGQELLKYVQDQNIKARRVMLLWLGFNAVFGILYLLNAIDHMDLIMLSVFYFLCDYICILIFCPFQTVIMKNRCCVNCRIYDWGHFMMFTPMLFIQDFFCRSLFFTSCVVLIKWEITYAKHPERFWSGSNKNLQCQHCEDKICQIKKRLM